MSDERPADFELVLPFVVCKSQGGPFDDRAFCAGVRFGHLALVLAARPDTMTSYEYPELITQLDLLAMHFGFSLAAEPCPEHPDEWALCTFTRVAGSQP